MRRRTFSSPMQQRAYDVYWNEGAPRHETGSPRRSGGLSSAYWNGYETPAKTDRYARSSLAYAAWAAGVDARRADDRARARETAMIDAAMSPPR
ncbi:MAG: hypothetical protein ACK53W_12500 [Gemmatimonadota bacterium]